MRQRGNRREKSKVHSNGKSNGHVGKTMSKLPGQSNGHMGKTTFKLAANLDTCSTDVKSGGIERDMFPRFSPWIVCAVTMAVRAHYVCQPKNWWILHPDEIFQTLEVAHSEVYGYGFRPHEYLSVPDDKNMTDLRYSEVKMGMHSMRSFLLPRFFIMVSGMAGMFGYTGRPFLLWKLAHVVVSSCLPLAAYKFSKTLFRSHDTGVIAALLTATSTHLSVFGTHTLINSFIGTPLFYALSLLFENVLLQPVDYKTRQSHNGNESLLENSLISEENSNNDPSVDHTKMNGMTATGNRNMYSSLQNGINGGLVLANGYACQYKLSSINGGVPGSEDESSFETCAAHNHFEQRDTNMNIIPGKTVSKPTYVRTWDEKLGLFCGSSLLVLCCYIRMDASFFVLITSLPFCNRTCLQKDKILPCTFGALVGIFVGVMDDFSSYGTGVISPYHWFQFNVVKDFSAAIYGRMDWTWYFTPMFYENPGVMCLTGLCIITVTCCGVKRNTLLEHERKAFVTMLKLCVSLILLLVLYSAKGHKELRFLYNFLVLLFILFAYCILIITNNIGSLMHIQVSHKLISCVLFIFMLSQWFVFPSPDNQSLKSWTYAGLTNTQDTVACFDYVSKQDDVTGVFTDQMVHMAGGYTVLHKDVPILGLIHYEFFEFSMKSRNIVPSADIISPKRNISVSTFTETSEFVSMYSTSYLLKLIITRKIYNYIIFNTKKNFLRIGYKEVFRSATKRVLKWNADAKEARQLDAFVSNIPLGTNATILTYEADWLVKFNEIELAKQRAAKAIELQPNYVQAYQVLALCYTLKGDSRSSGIVMGKCMKHIGKKPCYENWKRIHLHDDYKLSV